MRAAIPAGDPPSDPRPVTATDNTDRRRLVEELVADPGRQAFGFEPIADRASGAVIGYRSRSAGQLGSGISTTPQLIEAATALGLLDRLDWAVRTFLMDYALRRELREQLHFTPEPGTYGHPCPADLSPPFVRARRELNLAAEIPIAACADEGRLFAGINQFRSYRWLIVLDDVADRPDGLRIAEQVHPDWIRVDLDLPGRTKPLSEPVERMLDWAHSKNVAVLAHGVDDASRRALSSEIEATYVRGRLIGPAADLPR
jgi:EAL domain-containing protein (putative c-di-GMP-specific phosphodiesterase class I)